MAKPLEIVKAYIFRILGVLCICYLRAQTSSKNNNDDFTQWYKDHTRKVKELIRTNAPMLNKKQCQHLITKLDEVVEHVQKKVSTSDEVEKHKYILKDLRHITLKGAALVEECGSKDLCVAAVYQLENEEAFREILLQLECSFKASCLLHQEEPSIDFDIASHDEVDYDRKEFKEILEKHSNNNGNVSDQSSNIAKYLLERMQNLDRVKGGELDTLEFPNCKMYRKGNQLGKAGACGSIYESKWLGLTCATKVLKTSQGNEPKDCIMKFWCKMMSILARFLGLTSRNVVLTNSKGNLDQESMNPFHNEASILAGVHHPNLVKFIGMGKEDGRCPFVMMEKMDKNMSDLIGPRCIGMDHPFRKSISIDFIQQIAGGMYYLHDMHVAHRDLKPDNILWSALRNVHQDKSTSSSFGCVKLTDFGISKMEVGSETSKPDCMGTSKYRAPEVLNGNYYKLNYFKADVYSFGITCAEILCGELKFDQEYKTFKDIHKMIKDGKRPLLQGYSNELEILIGDCCAFNPSNRPTFSKIWKRLSKLKINDVMGIKCDSSKKGEDEKKNGNQTTKSDPLYGIHKKVKDVQRIMERVNLLGIVGMGGIGKSTLANAIFKAEKDNPKFNKRCYHHIGKIDNDDKCLEVLQNILKELGMQVIVKDLYEGRNEIKYVLEKNNVLFILDDVWDQRHLNNIIFAGTSLSNKNSKVLVCSRNWDQIKDHVEEKYDLQPLKENHLAMELFISHCFNDGRNELPNQFQHVGLEIVKACKGLPLSLKVLGANLLKKKRMRSWERVLQRLRRGRSPQPGHLDDGLFGVLEISFNGLDEEGKNMFLDICCFFLEDVYGDSLYVEEKFNIRVLTLGESSLMKTFETLQHRSLVEVDQYKTLQMHDQLRDMGRKIVELNVHAQPCNEDKEIVENENVMTKFAGTRLYDFDPNVYKQLKEKKMNFKKVEGILYRESTNNVIVQKDLNKEEFPKLRILLIRIELDTISLNFKNFKNLTTLNTNGCVNLKSLPNEVMNLCFMTSLSMQRCVMLVALPDGLGNLSSLKSLDLKECSKLAALPDGLGNLTSLTSLNLSGCSKLLALPNGLGNLSSLTSLNLHGCSKLSALPNGLGNLSSLTSLDLSGCSKLSALSNGLGNLSFLTSLDLRRCSKLLSLPNGLGNLSALISLDLSRCFNLLTLPDKIGNLSSLKKLDLSECSKLLSLPDGLGNLSSLKSLDLSGCSKLSVLPKKLRNLSSLTSLHLSRCSNLSTLSDGLGNLSSLLSLDLSGCSKLLALPNGLGTLSSLTSLNLIKCSNLSTLPNGLGNLSSLTSLDLSRCSKLSTLPNGLGNLTSLTSLDLSGCSNLSTLPDGLGNLSSLTSLDLSGCSNLSALPNGLGNLSSLTSLDLSGCSKLSTLPDGLENLSSLTSLDLSGISDWMSIRTKMGPPKGCLREANTIIGAQNVVQLLAPRTREQLKN